MTDTAPAKRRSRATVFTISGEVLMTAAVLILLFLGWKLFWQDAIYVNQQSSAADATSQEWVKDVTPHSPDYTIDYGEPPVADSPAGNGEAFAVLYVPRFGPDYRRNIAEGIGHDVLNSFELGLGHYPDTNLPGAYGNFAVASHRSAYGGGLHWIDQLVPGDPIIVQTKDGWYTYLFQQEEIVTPDHVEVLDAVPGMNGEPVVDQTPTERVITLTTCTPLYSTAKRIAAFGVFDNWRPLSAGPPKVIAAQVAAQG